MKYRQGAKFSKETQKAKANIKYLRVAAGYKLNEGAALLGLSRKQLEDVETIRNYGSFLGLELLIKISREYQVSLDWLVK